MNIPLAKPDIGQEEISAVIKVLESGILSRGRFIEQLEQRFATYTGSTHAVAMSSGTATLHCTLQALGIGPGDEVITTPYSVPATVNSIIAAGATPVMVDIDEQTRAVTAETIAAARSPKTRAVMAVYPFGMPIGIENILNCCIENRLHLIEDSCEALGTRIDGRHAGTFGVAGCFGLYPNKQITAAEGGICITDDESLAGKLRLLRNHGRTMDGSWLDQRLIGHNFRLSELHAAVGLAQLKRLPEIIEKRLQVARHYCRLLKNEARLHVPCHDAIMQENCQTSLFCFNVELHDLPGLPESIMLIRDRILDAMSQQGIQCSRYFAPLHLQPALTRHAGFNPGDYPVCERICAATITLPFFTSLSTDQQATVVDTLSSALDELI